MPVVNHYSPMALPSLHHAQNLLLGIGPPNHPLGQRTALCRFALLAGVQYLLDAQLPAADAHTLLEIASQFRQTGGRTCPIENRSK